MNGDNLYGSIYTVTLTGNPNICNLRSGTDRLKIKKIFKNVDSIIEKDWYLELTDKYRTELLFMIKELGFDGFFNWETVKSKEPSIGLFFDKFCIVRKENTVENLCIENKIVRKEFENQKDYVKDLYQIAISQGKNKSQTLDYLITEATLLTRNQISELTNHIKINENLINGFKTYPKRVTSGTHLQDFLNDYLTKPSPEPS
jgi:hypothetical protein